MYQLYINDEYVTEGHSDYIALALFSFVNDKARANKDFKIEMKWIK